MTAAGREQAAAAQAIAPALTSFARSLSRTRTATPADYVLAASWLQGCTGLLASAVNNTGYDAGGKWQREFLEGQATVPVWIQQRAYAAAQLIQNGANVTIAIRAARDRAAVTTLPALQAANAAWRACHQLSELIVEHHRALTYPQVPEYATIFGALQQACKPLATSLDNLAPRLVGVEPDTFSVWCEGFTGDLPSSYRDAARSCRAGGQELQPVIGRLDTDARFWRSRSRARPARR
jgi:hypothetical protein